MTFKLSNQAIGAIMMALQKSLMSQTDIVPVLTNFKVEIDDTDQLVIINPPIVEASKKPDRETIETSVQ